ncbi:MAG TPA: SRPBCC family protein [Planctomycetota bacterium]|nr:SRPBCC family protein [Planctomycetota bacterium]
MKDSSIGTAPETEHRIGGDGALGSALGSGRRPERTTTTRYQRIADGNRGTGGEKLADVLGVISLGLGIAELLAPEAVAKLVGVKEPDDEDTNTVRLMGVREIASGMAILSNQRPAKAVWSRVAGDAVDLALLGKTLANPDNDRGRTVFAMANVLAVGALDLMCARELSSQPDTPARDALDRGLVRARRSITIDRPPSDVYRFWREFANLPRFMRHLESVQVIDERRSHWVAKAPGGKTVEWDAELLEDRANESIAWASLADSDVENAGRVRFLSAPGGRGTEVLLELEYRPPFGKLGSKIAMLWREEPRQQAGDDLRHLKQALELGEIVVSDASKQRGMHAAVPDDRPVEL